MNNLNKYDVTEDYMQGMGMVQLLLSQRNHIHCRWQSVYHLHRI